MGDLVKRRGTGRARSGAQGGLPPAGIGCDPMDLQPSLPQGLQARGQDVNAELQGMPAEGVAGRVLFLVAALLAVLTAGFSLPARK